LRETSVTYKKGQKDWGQEDDATSTERSSRPVGDYERSFAFLICPFWHTPVFDDTVGTASVPFDHQP
jgi:hypothetical protein